MARVYADVSHFRAPFDSPQLTLNGPNFAATQPPESHDQWVEGMPYPDYRQTGQLVMQWPKGRRYFDISQFRQPYAKMYFQDNSLFGVDVATAERQMPEAMQRYVATGEPMPTAMRDVTAASAQVPWWAWLAGSGVSLYAAYRYYQAYEKRRRHGGTE